MFTKSKFKALCGSVLIGCSAALSIPAYATNEAMLDLLRILRDKGSISTEEYELLKNAADADGEQIEGKVNEAVAKVDAATKDLPKITTKGKLEIKGKGNSFKIGGRLQSDYFLNGRDDGFQAESENEFARARLFLSGTAFEYWKFKFQYDFTDLDDASQGIEDAFVTYTGFDFADITVGQRKTPFSLSELTSSKYIAFIDRPIVSNLFNESTLGVGNRNPGITFTSTPFDNTIIEGGFYTLRQISDGDDSIIGRDIDDGLGFTGRVVHAPIYDKNTGSLLSLGVSGGWRTYPNGFTGDIDADGDGRLGTDIVESAALAGLGVEEFYAVNANVAGQYNRFWGAAEYFYGEFDFDGSVAIAGDEDIEGYYFEGGIFLTDDRRGYKKGAFDKVKVRKPVGKGGIGAWEVAFRYDEAKIGAGIDNGEGAGDDASAFSAALNWYPVTNIRAQANYIKLFCEDAGDCEAEGEPDIFGLRTQIFF